MDDTTGGELISCAECGAPTVDGMNCWKQLGTVIAWEYNDPELLAEHFLTVASYNLQHPAQFTDTSLEGLRTAFIQHVHGEVTVAAIRRRFSSVYDGKQKVLKPESERQPVLRQWRMTIADVYIPDQLDGTADRVRAWAASIASEL